MGQVLWAWWNTLKNHGGAKPKFSHVYIAYSYTGTNLWLILRLDWTTKSTKFENLWKRQFGLVQVHFGSPLSSAMMSKRTGYQWGVTVTLDLIFPHEGPH